MKSRGRYHLVPVITKLRLEKCAIMCWWLYSCQLAQILSIKAWWRKNSGAWCHPAHVSSHSAVHGVMEVDSKVKLKPGEAVVRRLKILSYVDGYYVGRQSCVAKINNEDNVSEKNQKNTRSRSIIQLDRWIFTLSQSMKIEKNLIEGQWKMCL